MSLREMCAARGLVLPAFHRRYSDPFTFRCCSPCWRARALPLELEDRPGPTRTWDGCAGGAWAARLTARARVGGPLGSRLERGELRRVRAERETRAGALPGGVGLDTARAGARAHAGAPAACRTHGGGRVRRPMAVTRRTRPPKPGTAAPLGDDGAGSARRRRAPAPGGAHVLAALRERVRGASRVAAPRDRRVCRTGVCGARAPPAGAGAAQRANASCAEGAHPVSDRRLTAPATSAFPEDRLRRPAAHRPRHTTRRWA